MNTNITLTSKMSNKNMFSSLTYKKDYANLLLMNCQWLSQKISHGISDVYDHYSMCNIPYISGFRWQIDFHMTFWPYFSLVRYKVVQNKNSSLTNESTCPGRKAVGFVSPCKCRAPLHPDDFNSLCLRRLDYHCLSKMHHDVNKHLVNKMYFYILFICR